MPYPTLLRSKLAPSLPRSTLGPRGSDGVGLAVDAEALVVGVVRDDVAGVAVPHVPCGGVREGVERNSRDGVCRGVS